MPIIDIQKRSRTLGRIRLGQKDDRGQPQKLDRFRLTSASQPLLEKVAELYGGEVQPWTPAGGSPQFEVVTDSRRLPIMVPPQPISQWFEAWRKSGCVHRCDGRTNVLLDEPCDPEDPLHREATEKPTTRLNVVLRDVQGIGVWRVETKGWNAAVELPDVAEFLARAGGYVDGWLALEQRTSIDNTGDKPITRHFLVPIIEIDVTPAQLMAGHGRVAAPAVEGPVARPAIEAGPTTAPTEGLVLPTLDDIAGATDRETVVHIWQFLKGHDALTPELDRACADRARELTPAEPSGDDQAPAAEQAAEGGADEDALWRDIVATAGSLDPPMTTSQLREHFLEKAGVSPEQASAGELQAYLEQLRGAGVAA